MTKPHHEELALVPFLKTEQKSHGLCVSAAARLVAVSA